MPRYYEDKPEGGACAGLKEDLGACLLQSDCVLQEGKSPRQCLKEGNCKALKYSFFECKRSVCSLIPKIYKDLWNRNQESSLCEKKIRNQKNGHPSKDSSNLDLNLLLFVEGQHSDPFPFVDRRSREYRIL
ncbi:hypothetical protein DBR06_SOUSAS7210011, partial [Sousa chinensis]